MVIVTIYGIRVAIYDLVYFYIMLIFRPDPGRFGQEEESNDEDEFDIESVDSNMHQNLDSPPGPPHKGHIVHCRKQVAFIE